MKGTMTRARGTFGAFIRQKREARNIGLREMAKRIGVSPTYLSKVERDDFAPPAEDKVKAIAKIIEWDLDDLLARANRVSSDLSEIIKRSPVRVGKLLREVQELNAADHAELILILQKLKDNRL